MPDLWVHLPSGTRKKGDVRVREELPRWTVYHGDCGMAPVAIDLQDHRATFVCSGCDWTETVPLDPKDTPAAKHNLAAVRRLTSHHKPQTLQVQTVMGGPLSLVVAALVGTALRIRIAPYEPPPSDREDRQGGHGQSP